MVLDWRSQLRHWLDALFQLAGRPSPEIAPSPDTPSFQPAAAHFTVLLHLLTADFASDEEALEGLQNSSLFSLESSRAIQCLAELQAGGLAIGAKLTEAGRTLLFQSQYAPYAEELEALSR